MINLIKNFLKVAFLPVASATTILIVFSIAALINNFFIAVVVLLLVIPLNWIVIQIDNKINGD
jgi:hypothetical protein